MHRLRAIVDRLRNARLVREISDDGLFDAAASVAFWLLLSLPAAALALLSSVSLLGDDLTRELREAMLEFIDRVFTSEADALRDTVNGLFDQRRPGVLSVSILIAVFTVSRGFAGLIRALDTVYDIEESRNFAHTRLLAIGLAIGTLVMAASTTALWSFGDEIGIPVAIRSLGSLALVVLWSATIFHIGPNHHTPWRYDVPGAVFVAVGWIVLSVAFSRYVGLVGGGGGNDAIGATGALLLGLTFLWAACVVLLVGGEINEILASRAGVVQESRTVIGRVKAIRDDLVRGEAHGPHAEQNAEPDGDTTGDGAA